MKPSKNVTDVTPKYVKEFSCIGSACESSCCQGWTITLDKDTSRSYQKSSDPVIAKIAASHIKVMRSGRSDGHFSKIVLDKDRNCPFLDSESLCEVQKRLGESALSHTCNNYPRSSVLLGDQLRHSLSLSCPEAARKILLDPSAMWMEQESRLSHEKYKAMPEHLAAVNAACLDLVLLEDTPIEQRLYAMGVVLMQTQRAVDGKQSHGAIEAQVNRSLEQMKEAVNNDSLAESFQTLPFYAPPQIGVLMRASELIAVSQQRARERWAAASADFVELADQHQDQPEALLLALEAGWKQAQEFFDAKPHILMNYFIYKVFHDNFPFARNQGDYLSEYRLLVVDFFVLRCHLAAAALKGPLSEEYLITLVQSHAVSRQHSARFVQIIGSMMDSLGLVGCYAVSLLCTPTPDAQSETDSAHRVDEKASA